ncbi:MAG: creatininase family protein, partial [Rariglobus sp.]
MSSPWIANAVSITDWSHQTWSDLSARPDKARALVILPVHGFADHGLGLPLNTEQVVGNAVLRSAIAAARLQPHALVLPPVRFGAAPYAHTHFGVDPETVLETLNEIVVSVKASGFSRILFFNTSPWNSELVATAALDARTSLGLRTYVIGSAGIGLGFHPTDPNRSRTQAVAVR